MSLRITKLREKRGTLLDDMDGILRKAENDNRELNADETKDFDKLKVDLSTLDGTLTREEESDRLKAADARPVRTGVNDPALPAKVARPRYGKLKSFFGESAEENAYRSGMWIKATIFGDEKSAAWCREQGIAITKAQSEGVNTAGGFLVPEEFSSAIIDLRETFGMFRREAQVVPMARDTLSIPRRTSGVSAYFTGEGVAITASQMAWDQVLLSAKKLASYVLYSTELAEDAVVSLADILAGEIAYAFAEREDDVGWNGTGAGGATYGGIQGVLPKIIDGTHTASAIDAATGVDTFAEVTATDLMRVMAALPQYALERGASWYVSQPGWSAVFQRLVAAGGGNTIDSLTGRVRPSYLGYPIVISQKLPTSLGTINNTVMLLFGNLGMAVAFGDRRGITIATSEHVKFAEDQIAIRGTERFDINVHSLGDNTTAGPLIALIGNT